jgi:hypothetical protein
VEACEAEEAQPRHGPDSLRRGNNREFFEFSLDSLVFTKTGAISSERRISGVLFSNPPFLEPPAFPQSTKKYYHNNRILSILQRGTVARIERSEIRGGRFGIWRS